MIQGGIPEPGRQISWDKRFNARHPSRVLVVLWGFLAIDTRVFDAVTLETIGMLDWITQLEPISADPMISEVDILGVYFPPIMFLIMGGFILAYTTTRVLNITGLYRYIWHPNLVFFSFVAAYTSLLGLYFFNG